MTDARLRKELLERRESLDDVYKLYLEDSAPEERLFKNGWGCLSNRDIENIVSCRPRTLDELSEIPGIGPVKIQKYGENVLRIVRKVA